MTKYNFLRKIVKFLTKVYIRPTYEGLENIPKSGPFIIAGNHIHLVDPAPIMSITNRQIHFLSKASLFKYPQALIFKNMGLIPVNRDGKDTEAYESAIEYLKNGEIVGIYPEGTRERGRGLLPFKMGAVRMAQETNTVIIPFGARGKYKPFRKGITFRFGKPFKVSKDLEKSNDELREIIRGLIKE